MNYLNIISYRRLFNWSAAHLLGNDLCFAKRYPLVRIGLLLKPNRNIIKVEDNVDYKQVRLKTNGGGADLRGIKVGKDIGTKKQYQISTGQFIMSKIDARNGAFGIVDDSLNGAIVTADFPVFDVDKEKLNPAYLQLLSSTKQFIKFAQSCSRGTTNRQRIDVKQFLDLEIPLPSLEEQNAIVAAYNESFDIAKQYEKQADEKEDSIQQYIDTQLGINNVNNTSYDNGEQYSYLRFYHLKDILRWDCYNQSISTQSQFYQTITLSNLIVEKPKYGAGYKASRKLNEIRYIRITDINEDGTLNEDFVSADQYDEQYLLKQDDFLIARSGNTVGKTFLYDEIYGKAIYAGYLIKFVLDKSKINPQYLLAYTKSKVFKQWIQGNMRVSAQPNINSQQYLESPIIVPPMDVQNEIVRHISELKEQIKSLRALAVTTRAAANQQFENKIFE
ncbi:MAG: restriction endonuclease subunit S [Clostridia bacterium]|nr:restriction endonuclease subunit S [Clostridia bacterium]